METSTAVTQKGQVTIPAKVRKLMNLKTGDRISFVNESSTQVTIKPAKKFSILSLYGSLKSKVKPGLSGQALIRWEEQAWPDAAAEKDRKIIASYHKK